MTWRMAKSLEVLREQLNGLSPNRSKVSDGGIGNAEHASRSSDHNPWVMDGNVGVVTARDFTHDPAHGVDSQKLAEMLVASKDSRIKYIISNRRICSSDTAHGKPAWAWRPYTGKNPHDHHVHISVKPEKASYDDTVRWALTLSRPVNVAATITAEPASPSMPVLRRGDKGVEVMQLQDLLNRKGSLLIRDGDFGGGTETAVKRFQEKHNLVADGTVGKYTWDELND